MVGVPANETRLRLTGVFASVVLMFFSGCRTRVSYFPEGDVQTGVASWYGEEFHGRTTSSREVFDMHDLTAAHNSLPLGTQVVVTNLENGKSVTVRINDRGPFVKGRIIDLSYAAARAIDLVGPGTAPVRIEVLRAMSPPPRFPVYFVQVGAFVSRKNAEKLRNSLEKTFSGVELSTFRTADRTFYRVRLRAPTREAAERLAAELAGHGLVAVIIEDR